MKNSKYILIIIAITLSLTSMNCIGKRYEKKETVEYKINPVNKTKVYIENISGLLEVSKADSTEGIYVKADKIANVKKKDLDKPLTDFNIEVDTSGEYVKITGSYEYENKIFSFSRKENAKINFKIRIPENVKLEIDNVNGKIDVRNINEDIKITLINGDVNLEKTSGKNYIEVVNGDIFTSIDSTKGYRYEVINGRITNNLSKNFQGKISADVIHGKIDFNNIEVIVKSDDNKMFRGYIGDSDTEIKCEVTNGKIIFNGK